MYSQVSEEVGVVMVREVVAAVVIAGEMKVVVVVVVVLVVGFGFGFGNVDDEDGGIEIPEK